MTEIKLLKDIGDYSLELIEDELEVMDKLRDLHRSIKRLREANEAYNEFLKNKNQSL